MLSSNPLAQILDTDRLIESNHNDWLQNLRLDFNSEKLTHILNLDEPSKSTSDLLVIETNLTVSSFFSWVLDSGSSTHLYTSMQDLKKVRGLREDEITLRVDNGTRVAAIVIGTYSL